MPIDLTRLVTRNWPIKLAAAFLALMLYVAVAAQQQISQTFDLKVVVLVPPGRALLEQPPTVSVAITGKGRELLKLRSFPRVLNLAVPDTFSGSVYRVSLRAGDVAMPKDAEVQVSDMVPREITLTLDSVAKKDVRIVPLVVVVPDSGQELRGGLTLTPAVARIVGSDRALAGIESVTTVPTRISSVTGKFVQQVSIDTAPLGPVRIAPKAVDVAGELGPVHERVFAGLPVETGAGRTTSFTMVPSHVSVAVRGPEDRVQALTRDSLKVIAHVNGPAVDGAWAHLTVVAPRGITTRITPDSVVLRKKTGRG
jgi:YbbR domain-containing protein